MERLSSLTIFFPCFNDAGTIRELVEQAREVGEEITDDLEIIVVDDGSRDESPNILAELPSTVPELRVITHPENRGYGGALRSGFLNARKQFIFYTDGDGQYDVREIPLLVEKMKEDVELVNGYKIIRQDSWYRRLLGNAYSMSMRILFSIKIHDIDCDFRLFRKKLVEGIELKSDSGSICVEMLSKFQRRGGRFAEVGIHHYPRRYGKSQFFTFRNVSLSIIGLIVLFFRMRILRKN